MSYLTNPYRYAGIPLSPTFSSYSATTGIVDQYAPYYLGARNAVGVVVIAGGALDDYTAGSLKFKFLRTGSLTGNVYARIYTPVNGGLGTLQATSVAVSPMAISDGEEKNFTLTSNYTLQTDDMICIEYTYAGTGNFAIGRDTGSTADQANFDNSQATPNWETSGDYYSTYLVVNE